jgi:hypothetical protein
MVFLPRAGFLRTRFLGFGGVFGSGYVALFFRRR